MLTSRPRGRLIRLARASLVILLVASLAVVGTIATALVAIQVIDRSGTMLIAGRRGDVAEWPENTLPGVLAARALGSDAIEMDVRRSADGTFYLMHDATVDRTTDGEGAIARLHDQQIDALAIDGGLGYASQRGIGVPTLEEVLDGLAGYPGLILLDGKGGPDEHEALARLVMERGLAGRAWISSYGPAQADAVRSVGPIVTYGGLFSGAELLMTASPLGPLDALLGPSVTAIDQGWTGSEADPRALARRLGVRVYITNDLAGSLAWARALDGGAATP